MYRVVSSQGQTHGAARGNTLTYAFEGALDLATLGPNHHHVIGLKAPPSPTSALPASDETLAGADSAVALAAANLVRPISPAEGSAEAPLPWCVGLSTLHPC